MAEELRGEGWTLRVKGNEHFEHIARAPDELLDRLDRAMSIIVNRIEVDVIRRMEGYTGGKRTGKESLQMRTGSLARTVDGLVFGNTLDSLTGRIIAGSRQVPYARIHEFGGTVRPKRAQYLRVPLPDILTAGGAVKGEFELTERGGRHQTVGGLDTWISGRAIMVELNGQPTPIWALVSQVEIPPRLGIGETIDASQELIEREIKDAIGVVLRPPEGPEA